MGQVYWSQIAQQDLQNIGNFIADDAPEYAIEFVENLMHHTRILPNHPRLGRIVPEFSLDTLRELIYHNYRIVYEIFEDNLYIISIAHGSMDLKSKSEKEKWEIH